MTETSTGVPVGADAPTMNGEEGPRNATHNNNENENEQEESEGLLSEILYCIASFHAVATPVSITMIISALAVVYINTPQTRSQGEAAYAQTYQVFTLKQGDASQNFAASLGNVLIMVSVICFMTFVIVILYKYGCMKIFTGYMVIVTALLLGYFTFNMAVVAIQKYNIRSDKLSLAYIIWNYAIVGVLAIFFNTGIPKVVTQGYLVTSSVVLAWQLSYFNDWTAWTLLVMLALYDLFAVLSPCGPLRALTQLMSRPGARPLPGLLYEARLPTGVERPNRANANNRSESQQDTSRPAQEATSQISQQEEVSALDTTRQQTSSMFINEGVPEVETSPSMTFPGQTLPENQSEPLTRQCYNSDEPSARSTQFFNPDNEDMESSHREVRAPVLAETAEVSVTAPDDLEVRRGKIALALAKLYKLPVVDDEGVLRQRRRGRGNLSDFQLEYTPDEIRERDWTPQQLRTEVTVIFPERGGRIMLAPEQNFDEGKKYLVYNRADELLRTFVVNRQGKVMEAVRREGGDTKEDNTIKLGLVGGYVDLVD